MNTIAKATPATYADIDALPPTMVGEILHGVLYAHPRPAPRHAQASVELTYEINGPFGRGKGGPGGWIILVEPELHLGEHVLVPDIAGWRRSTLTKVPDTAPIKTPPDWVSEILSPSTARLDRTEKLGIYAEFNIGHAWLVDPDLKTLEVFELTDGRWVLATTFAGDDKVSAPPFQEHEFTLGNLWGA